MRNKLLLLISFIGLASCTEDRDIPVISAPTNPDYQVVHYWNFNDTSALDTPTQTAGGAAFTYAGAYFDDVDPGTDLNARNNDVAGTGLRLRNPSGDFVVSLPTTGFKDVVFTFATMRTSNGPQNQSVSYTVDGTNFINTGLSNSEIGVSEQFVLQQFDFSAIDGADNNANFKIKISFSTNADLATGNTRFDNITLDGIPTTAGGGNTGGGTSKFELFHYWNFNDATSTTTLIAPNTGSGSLAYSGAYYDSTTESTDINARNGDVAGTTLRLRNPSGDFIMNLPTTGHKNIKVTYATMRTGSGSATQTVSYTTNGTDYVTTGITSVYNIDVAFSLIALDFSAVPAANNNPNFKVKVSFDAPSSTATSGNNRIDNLTVEGDTL
ncbi:hypothetical protein ACLI08_10485 [Flavobacterium sp. RNTU_13]|uniref:hypothetical protein n=1 Tax=Flavobacterium sp. RNTU_13 TaxID=3375145 RepID=UPI003988056F